MKLSLMKRPSRIQISHLIIVFGLLFSGVFFTPAQTKISTKSVNPKKIVLTKADRQIARQYLTETRENFIKEIAGLSDDQINFKENDNKRWSIAEVAEHLIKSEHLIYSLVTKRFIKQKAPVGKDNYRTKDSAVWLMITNRNTKYNAPEQIRPKGAFKKTAEIISGFTEARAKTMAYIKETKTDLRNHFGKNPGLGMIDAYQWFIFLDGHTHRHLEQIREIKGHPDFPAK